MKRHSFIWLSSEPVRMYLPFGEKWAKDTGGLLWSMTVRRHLPVSVSHNLTSPSKLALRMSVPSPLNSTDVTGSECAGMLCIHSFRLFCGLPHEGPA